MRFMGIDMGTSGCKAVVFDEKWGVVCQAYEEYGMYMPGENMLELDGELVWEKIARVIRRANEVTDEPVTALAISAVGDIIIPVDQNGNSLRNAIVDFDFRGEEEIKEFTEQFGLERFYQITGMPPVYLGSLAKILWIQKQEPCLFEKTARWATFEDFILQKMGLPPVASYSEASRTMLFDIRNRDWSAQILKAAGLKRGRLPSAAESGTLVGTVPGYIRDQLGFSGEVLAAAGGHDMVCAAVGAGIDEREPGTAVDIAGTIEGIVVPLAKPNTSMEMCRRFFPCYVGLRGYVTFAVNLTAGCVVRWYRDELAADEYRSCRENGGNFYEFMQRGVDVGRPGSVYLIPHFSGSGNPFFDAKAKGAVYGLTLETDRADLGRAVVEGLAYELRMQLEAYEKAGIQIRVLRAVGGGSSIDRQLQLKANVTGKIIVKCSVTEASAMGAAVYAAIAAGALGHPAQAQEYIRQGEKIFFPEKDSEKRFAKAYGTYRRLSYAIHLLEQQEPAQ